MPDALLGDSPRRQVSPPSPGDLSSPWASPQISPKQMSSESRLLAAARKPLEALEQRMGRQMERLRTECEQAAASVAKRLEARLAAVEAPQKKMEQRLFEVCGRCEHVAASVKQQTGRMELLDNRATQWHRQMEDTVKAQQADFDRRFQGLSTNSACSTKATEESLTTHRKRISACEECLEENLRHGQEFSQALANLSRRLLILETRAGHEADQSPQRGRFQAESHRRLAGLSDESILARVSSLEEQWKAFQANSWSAKCKAENAGLVQHSDTGGCGSGDEVIDGFLALGDDDHPAWKSLISRLSSTETRIQDLTNTVAEIHADAKLGPELSMLVKHLQEIAPKVIEHERQLQMHSACDESFVRSLAEECKQRISQIEAGNQADRSNLHKLGMQHDEHQRSSESMMGRVFAVEAACQEAKGMIDALRDTWDRHFSELEICAREHRDRLDKQEAATSEHLLSSRADEKARFRLDALDEMCKQRFSQLEDGHGEHQETLERIQRSITDLEQRAAQPPLEANAGVADIGLAPRVRRLANSVSECQVAIADCKAFTSDLAHRIESGSCQERLEELASNLLQVQSSLKEIDASMSCKVHELSSRFVAKEALNAVVAERRESETKLSRKIRELGASSVDKQAWEASLAERRESERKLWRRIEHLGGNSAEMKAQSLDVDNCAVTTAVPRAPAAAPVAAHGGTGRGGTERSWFFNAAAGAPAASQEISGPGAAQHLIERIEEHCTWLEGLHRI